MLHQLYDKNEMRRNLFVWISKNHIIATYLILDKSYLYKLERQLARCVKAQHEKEEICILIPKHVLDLSSFQTQSIYFRNNS